MTPQQLKAMKLALEALELCNGAETVDGVVIYTEKEIAVLKEALAEHAMREVQRLGQEIEQEPVAYATKEDFRHELERRLKHIREEMKIKSVTMRCKNYDIGLPIIDTDFGRVLVGQVSTPPQRKPLLASEIVTMYAECPTSDNDMIDFARAIEAAHGIKDNT